MKIFGYDLELLTTMGAIDTAKEINQQPKVWQKIWQSVHDQKQEISTFLRKANQESDAIFLTGAGTSAFIGLSLEGVFRKGCKNNARSVSTTNLVSHPRNYLDKDQSVLLVSFARSGNSPESVAAVDLTEKQSKKCFNLIITCNASGELATKKFNENTFVFLLPEETNDKSLAMTSSYSGMLLAAILIARIDEIEDIKPQIDILSKYGEEVLIQYDKIKQLASVDFKRAVFLGSGPLYGTAKESQLKLQELSDGQVICKHDSYLGFRHGPKAVIDSTTLVVYLLSNDDHALKYEKDLINSMGNGIQFLEEFGVMETHMDGVDIKNVLIMGNGKTLLDEEFLTVCGILPSQLLGFFKSLDLGLKPDSPSVNGAIARVVEGVKIYPSIV